jgi:imidazoleglycerol-phosphate dehydratase/histidinol-phosphatase
MKSAFIDRDGTMVLEPEGYQLDSLDKLEFYPKAFQYLANSERTGIRIGNGDQSRRIRNGQFSEDTFGLRKILF